MPKKTFKQRILDCIDGQSPTPWGLSIGLGNGVITRIFKYDKIPAWKHLVTISKALDKSINWLLTGEERMGGKASPKDNSVNITLPIVTECGANSDTGRTAFYPCELPYENITFENCKAVRVSGNSMSPVAMHGQKILYSETEQVSDGDLVFVKLKDGSQLLKKYHKNKEHGLVVLHSVNNHGNKPILKKEKQIVFMYRVVGVRF